MLGEPGAGKLTGMKLLARDLARGSGWRPWRPMPVLAEFGGYLDGKFHDFLGHEIERRARGHSGKVLAKAIDELMRSGRVALLLDALDEVPTARRTVANRDVAEVGSPRYQKVPVVVTGRAQDVRARELGLSIR